MITAMECKVITEISLSRQLISHRGVNLSLDPPLYFYCAFKDNDVLLKKTKNKQ